MNNEELLNKIKTYEEKIICLENELQQTKVSLKKYTDNTKKYYETHKQRLFRESIYLS